MTIENYLHQKYTKGTTRRYYRDIKTFITTLGNEKAQVAGYAEIMDYIGVLRKQHSPENIKVIVQGIKKYYNYLNHERIRKDHPCKYLRLRDKISKDIQLQDFFKSEELELLMERKERYKALKIKNQVIISLLIYQGLTVGEIINLEIKDINLEEGTIYIKRTTKTNSRTLKLKTKQVMLFYNYLNEARLNLQPVAAEKSVTLSHQFILTKLGTPENGEGINYLVSTFKYLFPERNLNPKTIRQSVITNLLKQGNDLRVVQVFAGHRYPSATERYKQNDLEELKHQINKFHPLNITNENEKR